MKAMVKIKTFVFIFLFNVSAFAYTDCGKVEIKSVFTGQGVTYVIAQDGTTVTYSSFATSIPDAKAMTASLLAARALNIKVSFRYAAANVNCTTLTHRSDVVGVWN